MYNLFIGYVGPNDPEDSIYVSVSRFLEYTDEETQMRFRELSGEAARTIRGYPALFMREEFEDGAFVGRMISITEEGRNYRITFERDTKIGVISPAIIEAAALELRIDSFEFYRTHWAVKRGDLYNILAGHKLESTTPAQQNDLPENVPATDDSGFNKSQVFIVHGHDEYAKADAKSYVESRGLEPIILHLQASGGRTIIEKIDHYTNVGFGIVLYTECDVGAKRDSLTVTV